MERWWRGVETDKRSLCGVAWIRVSRPAGRLVFQTSSSSTSSSSAGIEDRGLLPTAEIYWLTACDVGL